MQPTKSSGLRGIAGCETDDIQVILDDPFDISWLNLEVKQGCLTSFMHTNDRSELANTTSHTVTTQNSGNPKRVQKTYFPGIEYGCDAYHSFISLGNWSLVCATYAAMPI